MHLQVILHDIETDKTAIVELDYQYHFEPEEVLYLWNEGNYSCDCNRLYYLRDKKECDTYFNKNQWGCGICKGKRLVKIDSFIIDGVDYTDKIDNEMEFEND